MAAKRKTTKRAPRSRFSEDDFWKLIDRVKRQSKGDLEGAIAAFEAELGRLGDADLQAAAALFDAAMKRAYDYGLWGAAYVIHGGCGDDAFWDFRAGLIALGRKVYEAALAKPDSLAAVKDVADRTLFEGFQYVPERVLEARKLEDLGKGQHHKTPTGTRRKGDSELPTLYPRLAKRFWPT
jgi:hypothetical protein